LADVRRGSRNAPARRVLGGMVGEAEDGRSIAKDSQATEFMDATNSNKLCESTGFNSFKESKTGSERLQDGLQDQREIAIIQNGTIFF
jgi:hypothetical protein